MRGQEKIEGEHIPGNLMSQIVETVSKCSDEFDDNVQLHVIKVLLVAVTSEYCNVHEGDLLLAIRACFHVNLITKNQANKATAKAALTQILSVVNQRMEVHDIRIKSQVNDVSPLKEKSSQRVSFDTDCNDDANKTSTTAILFNSDTTVDDQSAKPQANTSEENVSDLDDKESGAVSDENGDVSEKKEEEHVQDGKVDSRDEVYNDSNDQHDKHDTVNLDESVTKNDGFGVGNFDDASTSSDDVFPSVYHKDAFLLYRALCKLSMKSLQDSNGNLNDPIVLQNKILSLELILHILSHCGAAFRSGEKFIHASKSYLCVSILENCTSQVNLVTSLSLQVFVALMDNFKDHLKSELEVFVTNIFLRILESENSPYEHKLRVLDVFHNIINDSTALVEIFINFDCDFEAIDLFRRIIDAFSKIAKISNVVQSRAVEFMTSKKAASEEHNIRSKCCEGLVIILKSIKAIAGISTEQDSLEASTSSKSGPRKSTWSAESPLLESENGENNSSNDDDDVNNLAGTVMVFDMKQKVQEEIETGILKFNLSAKKGIAYLAGLGHIENTPAGVSNFFRQYADRLDKTAIGEYLGREREYENGFCLKVLHEYVDSMDFTNMKFDIAIRHFLKGFRLPGEAQKIDRIMEKFAERYYLQNRGTFPSADMAFILAFSTIMLQTNLHNPAIRDDKRMTKDQFIKQNKNISSDGELSDEMLMEIYDRIQAEPISLNTDNKLAKRLKKDDTSFLVFPSSSDKKRKDAYDDERKEMVRISEAMFKQKLKSRRNSTFVKTAETLEAYARPMFEIAWPPVLSVFSQTLETTDDTNLVTFCLDGFKTAIQIAGRMDLSVARNTFVNSVTKFTTLDSVRSMQPKHIEAIKILLYIAQSDGEYLNESWGQILQFISQLSRLQLFADNLHTDDMFFSNQSSLDIQNSAQKSNKRNSRQSFYGSNSTLSSDAFKFFSGPSKAEAARQLEETNAEMIMLAIDTIQIDKIFLNSTNLSIESMHFFVKALCSVSLSEINSSSAMNTLRGRSISSDTATPRVFSLQKIVEVADYNMHIRPRIAWSNMWNELSSHFARIGVNENYALSMYAVDSLKQLSIKFLQKEELSNFNFQRLFLKPFEVIFSKTESVETKELILRCLDIMIRACAANIRSGWRSIFAVFEVAASHDKYDISSIAFEITEKLMNEKFELLIFDFVELMNCLVAFVAGPHSYLSLSALSHLSKCADLLAEGAVEPALDSQNVSSDTLGISFEKSSHMNQEIGEDASVFRLWWPLLLGLSTRVADNRLQVRTKALEVLLYVLKSYGHLFSQQTWDVIFKGVLLPILDSAKTDSTEQPTSSWPTENPDLSVNTFSWIGTTAASVLDACSTLYLLYKSSGLTASLLSDLLNAIEGCICQETESLARIGLRAMYNLVISLGDAQNSSDDESRVIEQHEADLICEKLCSCLTKNLCLNFLEVGTLTLTSNKQVDIRKYLAQCPLASRRLRSDSGRSKGDVGLKVKSSYGVGVVMQELSADENSGVLARKRVLIMGWGANLYTREDLIPLPVTEDEDRELQELTGGFTWDKISKSVLTSMIVALELSRIIGEVSHTFYSSWTREHRVKFAESLALCFDHARSFNLNKDLRQRLYAKQFMRFPDNSLRPPNIIEQEVQAGAQLLIFFLRSHSGGEKEAVNNSWIEWVITTMIERYLELEGGDAWAEKNETFMEEHKVAYISPVAVALRGISNFTPAQFQQSKKWILSFLSKLITCEDKTIRESVREIYDKHIHPIVLS